MNGIIVIDKPPDWTSHDVVAKLRGVLRERRVGHSGTLDPMATGVLPVFFGRATRAVEFAEADDKEYLVEVQLGIITDTQDTTGTVLETREHSVGLTEFSETASRFAGKQLQLPPMYSAIKVGGKKLYELARRGEEIPRSPREITIHSIDGYVQTKAGFSFKVVCSKGTYIRTLCHDIGISLGCGGAMSSLMRTRAGVFSIKDAVTLEDVSLLSSSGRLSEVVKGVDFLFKDLPSAVIDRENTARLKNGAVFFLDVPPGDYRIYSDGGEFLAFGSVIETGGRRIFKAFKSFYEV